MGRFLFIVFCLIIAGFWLIWHFNKEHVYQQMLDRLQAESRAALVIVTSVNYDERSHQRITTIKFVEEDSRGHALPPKYFTFNGNLIQFQSLVVRFEDKFVAAGDRFKGRSVYLFWKVFRLDGPLTQEFPITQVNEIPGGYKIPGRASVFENRFWKDFWRFAFDESKARSAGIKSVQIEAPGVVFVPGYLYTIHIEHNAGLRIDAKPVDLILRGEKILSGFKKDPW
ncbi:MAG: hypothetical protein HQL12_08360 [Candidatus Omnitrophica bacterium]|nr:hypothetical protein [Candidatus Omnitrophota bacterium]